MAHINLEDELLYWIATDVEARSRNGESLSVPVQMLMTKMSMRDQTTKGDLSQSTLLSLKSYDRATLLRTLKLLESKDFIQFVDKEGLPQDLKSAGGVGAMISDWQGPEYVTATEAGIERAEMIIRKFNL